MSPIDFIYTNINTQLLKEGFPQVVASTAAWGGVDEYKRRSRATKKGHIYDDCLSYARKQAKLHKKSH